MQRCLNIDPAKISLSFILSRDLCLLFQFSCVEITCLVRLGHSHVFHHGECSGQNDDVDKSAYSRTSIQSPKYRFLSTFLHWITSLTWRFLVLFSPKEMCHPISSGVSYLQPTLSFMLLLLPARRGSLFVPFLVWDHLCFVS